MSAGRKRLPSILREVLVKATAAMLGSLVLVTALCWALGLIEFTYPKIVPNQPLRKPRRVVRIEGTNMMLDHGQMIALFPRYGSEPLSEQESIEIGNQVARSWFEVDVEPRSGREVTLYVRWPRKFRDSSPPFTIPLIRETVGRSYRKLLTDGTLVGTRSQPEGAGNRSQPAGHETNQTSSASGSGP